MVKSTCVLFFALRSERARSQNLFFFLDSWCFTPWTQSPIVILFEKLFNYSGLCTYQCKSREGGVWARGGDLMPETIPLSGFWSCEATPGSGHLTLTDRSQVRPSRLSESHAVGERYEVNNVYFEKGFIIKFPSDCKTRLKSNSSMKVRGFFTGHWSDLFRHVEQML